MSGCPGFHARRVTAILWAVTLAAIPVTSYFGRTWQRLLTGAIGRTGIGWLMAAVVAVLLVAAAVGLARKAGWTGLFHLMWMILLAGALMYLLRRHPERWLHIPLFGMLGFLSVRLFFRTGAEIALAVAFLDELFQYYHPERVGDFADVVVNAVCVSAGIIFFFVLSKLPKKV